MKRITWKLSIIFLILVGVLSTPLITVWSQTVAIWNDPVNISNMLTDSTYPAIVADGSGGVHVFWAENLPDYGDFNNLIYYSSLYGGIWSQPVDILTSPQGLQAIADQPAAAVGPDGKIHLVFVGGWNGEIYYSSSYVGQATRAKAWKMPTLLSSEADACSSPDIKVDLQGVIHVAYAVQSGAWQGIYHIVSEDNGENWSFPELIKGTTLGNESILEDVRMAVSPDGTVHIVWMWTNAHEVFPPKGIYYVRSGWEDRTTWTYPQTIVKGPYRYPDVVVVGKEQVVLVWSGSAENRFKFSQWSPDNGKTWSNITRIPHLGGFQGYAGMAVDSQDRLHLAMAATDFEISMGGVTFRDDTLIHSIWSEQGWSEPEPLLINAIKENNLASADIVITEGNIAHIVVAYPIYTTSENENNSSLKLYQNEIYYVQGLLNSPHNASQPLPNLVQTAYPQHPVITSSPENPIPVKKTEIPTDFGIASGKNANPLSPVYFGAGNVLLFVIILILMRTRLRNK